MDKMPSKPELQMLRNATIGMGVMRKNQPGVMSTLNVVYYPYATTQAFYDTISRMSLAWHKVMCLAAWDQELIDRLYRPIALVDPYIRGIMELYDIRKDRKDQYNFTFARTDFINDTHGVPKITEYNGMVTSIFYQSQAFSDAKILTDPLNKHRYFQNKVHDKLWEAVGEVFRQRKLTGLFLHVAGPRECNDFEFCHIEIAMMKQGVRAARCTMAEAGQFLTVKEDGSLFYYDQEVSFVYYMDGYIMRNYEPETELSWKGRRLIEESKVIRSPGLHIELSLQKRMQCQLSKPEVVRKYLSEEEAQLIEQNIVPIYDFDSMSEEQFKDIFEEVVKNEGKYILKPNAEGGGNNLFGADVTKALKKMSPQQRKTMILQQKIESVAERELVIKPTRTSYAVNEHRLREVSEEKWVQLLKDMQVRPQRYILRSIEKTVDRYQGREVPLIMNQLSAEERKGFLLEEITDKQLPYLMTGGGEVRWMDCDRQLSHFGIVESEHGQITSNYITGYLVRDKPITSNEAGVMKGEGSISAWIRKE